MLQKGVVTHTKAIKARLLSDLQQLGVTGLILVEVVVVLPVHDDFLRACVWTWVHRGIHIKIARLVSHDGLLLLFLPALVDLRAEEGPTHGCTLTTPHHHAIC